MEYPEKAKRWRHKANEWLPEKREVERNVCEFRTSLG